MVSSQNLEGFFVSAFADQESRGFTGEDQQDQLKTTRSDLEELIEDKSVVLHRALQEFPAYLRKGVSKTSHRKCSEFRNRPRRQ